MLNIGILGAARIAPESIIEPAARRDDTTILAVASRSGTASEYAAKHGIQRPYDSYEEMLADPEIELVYNALAGNQHGPMSIAAMQAGKHVLCEKPAAMRVAEAREMVATAARTGRRMVEAFHYRYHPGFLHVLDLVQSGRLGGLVSLNAVFTAGIPNAGRELRYQWEMGGGAFMDLGCYTLHYCRALTGEEPEVTSATTTKASTGVDLGIKAELMFPSGVTASVHADMTETNPLTWFLDVVGEKGTVKYIGPCKPHEGHSIEERIAGQPYRVHTVGAGTSYDYQLAAVVDALATGAPLPTEGDDQIGNMAGLDAIYAAAGYPPR